MTTSTQTPIPTGKVLSDYQRSFAVLEQIIAAVPEGAWDQPSKCDGWCVADVAGHVIWGQQLIRCLVIGATFTNRDGAPGAAAPSVVIGEGDPLTAFMKARDEALEVLTPEALTNVVEIGAAFGTAPLAAFATALSVVDALAHAWDIGAAAGLTVTLPEDLVAAGDACTRAIKLHRDTPGGIKSALEPPSGADAQTRFLAFLGRRAW